MVNAVLGCRPKCSRIISIRERAVPFNVTSIHVYAPTSDHDDNEVKNFYQQLQEIIDQNKRRTFWLYNEIGIFKLEGTHRHTGETYVDPTTMLRQIVVPDYYNLVLTDILGPHISSIMWTWHSQDRKHHTQIDYILVRK